MFSQDFQNLLHAIKNCFHIGLGPGHFLEELLPRFYGCFLLLYGAVELSDFRIDGRQGPMMSLRLVIAENWELRGQSQSFLSRPALAAR